MSRSPVATPLTRGGALFAALGGGLFVLYTLLDLREGGRASSLLTTRLSTPGFYIAHFGGWFFWGSVVLDAALALASARLITASLADHRARRGTPGYACTTGATLLLGFAVFGCPGCMIPLFGTLGVAAFANALPLFGLEFKLLALVLTAGALAWSARARSATPAAGLDQAGDLTAA